VPSLAWPERVRRWSADSGLYPARQPAATGEVLASLTIAGPVSLYLRGGQKVRTMFDAWKTWLGENNATVMAVLLLVLGPVFVGKGISGLSA
jgi:hypothetical protein